jgi:hypothetical protein
MIVNTFISDGGPIPEYTNISLRQARKTNPNTDIRFICKDDQPIFSELNIEWVPQDSIGGNLLDHFNELCWFRRHGTPQTSHPSPELFWHRTAERIYYLQAYIDICNLESVFHFENDVLLYHDLSYVSTGDELMVAPMSDNQTTFAIAYIPEKRHINNLCLYMNWLLSKGEACLQQILKDHVSEMSLLNLALREEGYLSAFATLPQHANNFVFDPGSYGQFLGGTNNGHSSGFTDPKHIIGKLIDSGELNVKFDGEPSVNGVKIFNLHIHSKNLQEFAGV